MTPPPDLLDTPELAIQAFEKSCGLQVVVHDLFSTLGPFLQPERFKHHAPCCVAVKASHDWACVDFEINRLRKELPDFADGRLHQCHAGFLEWVIPVFIKGRLEWVLFAGQRKAVGGYRHLVRDIRDTKTEGSPASRLARVDEAEALIVLELLRQLRSRLLEWHTEVSSLLKNTLSSAAGGMRNVADRRQLIQAFLHTQHTGNPRLSDLAKTLNLGESRTSHLIKELFGQTYVQLLNELRLRTAASLLRESSLPVLDVALNSGFSDPAHFYRCFQKRFSSTPLKYRKSLLHT